MTKQPRLSALELTPSKRLFGRVLVHKEVEALHSASYRVRVAADEVTIPASGSDIVNEIEKHGDWTLLVLLARIV